MSEREPDSLIKTPLEFFGHSASEIYFGYPQQFGQEMAEAVATVEQEIAAMQQRRAELAAGAEPTRDDRYLTTDVEYQNSIAYSRQQHIGGVKHKWYERRFRGRYESNVDLEQHPEVQQFVDTWHKLAWDYDLEKHPLPSPLPSADAFASYFNEAIRLNEWSSTHWQAKAWHDALPEDSPDRKTAKNYLAFAGNIVLQEYCRLAVTLASDELADDDFFSVKHLLTVCWPMADRLEPSIPEEVGRAKQVLREAFLQMAARGSSSFRTHVEFFGSHILGQPSLGSRDENEAQAYKALMAFGNMSDHEALAMKQELYKRAETLATNQQWAAAIDLLELSSHAYGFEMAEFQETIDRYALEGTLYYTRDMSRHEETWMQKIGKHEYPTCDAYMLNDIRMTPGISDEMHKKMYEIEDVRGLEHQIRQLQNADPNQRDQAVIAFFEKLSKLGPEIAVRFANPDLTEQYVGSLLKQETVPPTGLDVDYLVETVIDLHNQGVLTTDQQNTALTALSNNLLAGIESHLDYESFTRFIGFISPILRRTPRADASQKELVWKLVSADEFATFMDKLIRDANLTNPIERTWLSEQKQVFLTDIRVAWKTYWDEHENY